MCCHPLADNPLHSRKTNSVLVLKKLTYSTYTAVAKVVNIVTVTNSILKMHIIVNGSKYIFPGYVFRNKLTYISADCLKQFFFIFVLIHKLLKKRIVYFLCYTKFLLVSVRNMRIKVYHHIRQHLNFSLLCLNPYIRNRSILDLIRKHFCKNCACRCNNSSCSLVYSIP